METNLDCYKDDLESLISMGNNLYLSMKLKCFPDKVRNALREEYGSKVEMEKIIKNLPSFAEEYQLWYSEAIELIKQVLPDRLLDFVSHYDRSKSRKSVTFESYRIGDYLQGLQVARISSGELIRDRSAAIPHFRQQLAILKSVKRRFESSLFDIKQLVQADLFDSELDAARELAKHKFLRAAGALAGVVLERHLKQVCDNHNIKITKKTLCISDLNNALKDAGIIDTPTWRSIQYLADIRNLCDHNKKMEPTVDQVNDLLDGVSKITKTLF